MTREEAIKGLKALRNDFSGYKPNEEMFDMAIEALEADVPETNVGKWIKVMEGNAYRDKCSRCSETYPNAYGYNFCPNCRARMKREQKHLGNKSDLVILDEVKYE